MMKPALALATVRGRTVMAVSSESWVAANAGEVERAIKATKAIVPKPTPTYSKVMTMANIKVSAPASDNMEKPKIVLI